MFSALNDAAGEIRYLSREGVMPLLENLNQQVTAVSAQVIKFRESELGPLVTRVDKQLNEKILVDAAQMMQRLNASAAQLQTIVGEENRDKLDVMAEALLEYETIDRRQIVDIMEGRKPSPPEHWDDTDPGTPPDAKNVNEEEDSLRGDDSGTETGFSGGGDPAPDH